MKNITAKRDLFIERWSKAEYINSKLGLMLICHIFLVGVLVIVLIIMSLYPKPVYYISPQGAGVVNPSPLPESAIGIFVLSWLMNWANFTPANIDDVYLRSQKWMSADLWAKTQQNLKNDIDNAQRNNMSSHFSLEDDPKIEQKNNGYQVILKGQKGINVGNQNISTQHLIYTLNVKRIYPTLSNPYGLVIDDIEQELVK